MTLSIGGPFDPGTEIVIYAGNSDDPMRDVNGTIADPSSFTWQIKGPSATTPTEYDEGDPECANPEPGVVTLTITPGYDPGRWDVTFTGHTGLKVADEGQFLQNHWAFTPPT